MLQKIVRSNIVARLNEGTTELLEVIVKKHWQITAPKLAKSKLAATISRILDFCIPEVCVLCDTTISQLLSANTVSPASPVEIDFTPILSDAPICSHCVHALPYLDLPSPSANINTPDLHNAKPASHPAVNLNPTPIELAPLEHSGAGRYLVSQLKFHRGYREGKVLAKTIAEVALQAYPKHDSKYSLPQVLVPAPLSRRNYFTRGYNQAYVLATYIGELLKIPVEARVFTRIHSAPQRSLTRKQRLLLSPSTFTVHKVPPVSHVAIVDDVITSGRTTQVLRNLLLQRGIQNVDIWCATRTPIHKTAKTRLQIS